MRVEIRRIGADQGPALMRVRLMALLDAPYAFAATYTDSVQRPTEEWAERALEAAVGGRTAIYLAHAGHDVIAMAGGFTPDGRPLTRQVFGVWVEPAFRDQGLGRRMVESVVAWAGASGAETIELWVADTNEPAIHLYRSMGFEETERVKPMPSSPGVSERLLVRRAGPARSV